jgi:hypothetical protein
MPMHNETILARHERRNEKLRFNKKQHAYWTSRARFHVLPCGRRSGKTELAKRKLVSRAIHGTRFIDSRFFAGAPTWRQAKSIFWSDLRSMVPRHLIVKEIASELTIRLYNAAGGISDLSIFGLDRPERIEGQPWDGGVLDEFANMKPAAWMENVRPALSDRAGWCDLIGVPEGRNHYYELYEAARSGTDPEWAAFTWKSAEILPAKEIESARRGLDELVFQQEYEASFVNFSGRAYYGFSDADNCGPLPYDPKSPLNLCFDFNIAPGVAAMAQEMKLPNGLSGTGWIGEVYIPANSNTLIVCERILQDWGHHPGLVVCYGDSSGGAGGSAQVMGSDWDLIASVLKPHFGKRLHFRVPRANPPVRVRINSVNSRFRTSSGEVHMMIDPAKCPMLIRDFEGVRVLEGGAGDLDKKRDPKLTHISDAAGYYIATDFPVSGDAEVVTQVRL